MPNKIFYKVNLSTIIAVYFLILVGGIVRSTGAGMGCPDWPKCFGNYIPPTSDEALPENYESVYTTMRLKKNQRFASVLEALGFDKMANRVKSDPGISEHTYFDVTKAWIEYVNRLIGVAIGLFIIANLVYSIRSGEGVHVWLGVTSFVLVIFQGWIGSLVVSTNLLPGFISFHMFLALFLVALLIYQNYKLTGSSSGLKGRGVILSLLILFTLQVLLGTGVREQVDMLGLSGIVRSEYIDNLGTSFLIHRSYSLLLLGLAIYFVYLNRSLVLNNIWMKSLMVLFGLEILLGIILTYGGFPSYAQPLHLFVGSLAFGVIFYLFLNTRIKSSIG